MPHGELDTPVTIVDLDVLEANIERMALRARATGVRLRPHAKAHKSTEIARMQLAAGATGLTVAKLGEAEVLAAAGATDLLIAYPIVGPAKLARLRALARQIRVIATVDDVAVARGIAAAGVDLGSPIEIMVEVDSGLHRCGLPPGDATARLVRSIVAMPGLRFLGLLTHAGHVYRARSHDEREAIALQEARALVDTAQLLSAEGIAVRELSVGSSPTAGSIELVANAFPSITEFRPGTYVFNDLNQVGLGVASEPDCALRVLVTVISRPAADRVVVDAGSKTLAADTGVMVGFGRVRGSPELVVDALSEEHAVIPVPASSTLQVGDRLELIPNHACPVPNLTDALVAVRGGAVERTILVDARGRNR